MTLNNPHNIEIPEHWLTDDNVTTYWSHAEGIWVNNRTEPYLRAVAVYLSLMDIPEAKSQLEKCNEQFANEFGDEIPEMFDPIIKQARAGLPVSKPGISEAGTEKVAAIYDPWVNTWILGSSKMNELIAGMHIIKIIADMLPFNREDLRRQRRRITQMGSNYSPPWVWETLLSSEYRKIDQANRDLARRELTPNYSTGIPSLIAQELIIRRGGGAVKTREGGAPLPPSLHRRL